jgi:membrane associated rhomboid family serine protease
MSPHEIPGICTIGIIVTTCIYSGIGFKNPAFRDKHLFSVPEILAEKEYHRVFTSALLHADFNHLLLNMFSLFLFGRSIESDLGAGKFLLIYLVSVLGGSVLALWIHRHHEYKAYGASGGVCGVIFSYIILFPGSSIMMFPVPFWIPAWLYAILFIVGSTISLRRQADNIGHDAHLGGAIIGFWFTAALVPDSVRAQPKLFLAISILAVLLFIFLLKMPLYLPLKAFVTEWQPRERVPEEKSPQNDEKELDAILEKISRKGIQSLSRREKKILDAASKKRREKS